MTGQVSIVFLHEGASTNRPPGFDGKYYYYWKGKMKLFLESQDVDLLDIIQVGPYKPKKRDQAEVEIEKPKEEWTPDERAKVFLNSKAKFFLTCSLSR